MFFDKTVKNINRIREVIKVLVKYGFEDIVVNSPLRRFVPRDRQLNWTHEEKPVFEFTRWERVRMVIEELGPTFIKLAQSVSNRPELLPPQLIEQFQRLQDKVPPFNSALARQIVETETGGKIDDLFVYFDDVPLGSASIGQVHRARLRKNGRDVVVKVQRKGVYTKVTTDLSLLKEVVKLLENFFHKNGILNPLEIVETFEKSLISELDYTTEARHLTNFKALYKDQQSFYVPEIFDEYSTRKVLVMEFISGCKITDLLQLKAWGLDPEKIAEKGLDIYLQQIFDFGYFHADPHPGNVLVRPNGTIVLIDFGMVGKLNRQNKFAFAGIFIGLANQDARAMATNLRRLAIDSEIDDIKAFENDLTDMVEDLVVFEQGREGMSAITNRLQALIYKYGLKVPGSVYLVLRALAILEGIGGVLHPNFNALEPIRPYGAKIVKEQYSLENLSLDVFYTGSQLTSLLYNLPVEIRSILKKVRKGTLNLNIELIGYREALNRMDTITNKLTIAIINAALLVASSISMTVNYPPDMPRPLGFPLISFIGFTFSFLLGLMLFFYITRKKQ